MSPHGVSRRRALGASATAVLLSLAIAGCGRRPSCRGQNLLVVVIDTLRADHLGCYGYGRDTSPRLDALAKESILYERCESQATWTLASTATILTGLYPFTHGLVKPSCGPLTPDAVTLAERLHDAGYATYAYSANNVVTYASGFNQGFDRFETGKCPDAGRANEAFLPWIDEAAVAGKPFFLYVHYFDPHHPYDDPAGHFAKFGGQPGVGIDSPDVPMKLFKGEPSGLAKTDVDALVAHYDGEIRFVDDKLGELIDRFRARGLLDNTLVVVTADHGEQFLEHGWVRHGNTVFEEETHVPLIVRIPGEAATRVASRVECADVTPTVLDLLDVRHDDELDGVSLRRIGRRAHPDDLSFSETQHRFEVKDGETHQYEQLAIRRGKWKLLVLREQLQLFDLEADPGEQHDLVWEERDVVQALRNELNVWKSSTTRRSLRPAPWDPKQGEILLQRIKANGYLPDVKPSPKESVPFLPPSAVDEPWWPQDHDEQKPRR
ncbi:MAG: sulfatase [Planctomycetes bacterium]|nr:sulfatase [Planctomycetota bacterium]MBI3845738.1 sulfatase [Planctomycetota bacterium]